MRRVLCVGYSVTEAVGYVEAANALAAEHRAPLHLARSGWGGHTIGTIAYMIDEIVATAPCDLVLLEVFTGGVRGLGERRIGAYLEQILVALARSGLPVAFLNVYQGGIDYHDDFLTRLAHRYAERYRIPILDLTSPIFGMREEDRHCLLKDNVHTTPLGGELYGAVVYHFLRGLDGGLAYAKDFRGRRRESFALAVPSLVAAGATFDFRRNGTPLSFVEIPEGSCLVVDLPGSHFVEAVMLTYGPRSGRVRFRNAGTGEFRDVTPYDDFSYYTRSGTFDLNLHSGTRLTIAQSAERPSTPLRKGEPSREARVGRVSHLFCRRPTVWSKLLDDRRGALVALWRRLRGAGERATDPA